MGNGVYGFVNCLSGYVADLAFESLDDNAYVMQWDNHIYEVKPTSTGCCRTQQRQLQQYQIQQLYPSRFRPTRLDEVHFTDAARGWVYGGNGMVLVYKP